MLEVELKFQIPASHQDKLHHVFVSKRAKMQNLHAKYYDTPERHLAKNKISLRQRLEGTHWVQTLKLPSDHHLKRFELEIDLGELAQPVLDFSIYTSHPEAKRILKDILQQPAENFVLQFETDVERQVYNLHYNEAKIEVSLDQGEIRHGSQKVAIHEIEFELKQGEIVDLIKCIQPWIKKYHLYLDVRSKAQRGDALSQDTKFAPVQHATALELNQYDSKNSALQKIINNTLQHLLPNATAIATEQYQSEHVHQLRVAIRRLRSALRIFGDWSNEIDPEWQNQFATLFRQLGSTRDRDALTEDLLPRLEHAGAPYIQLPEPSQTSQLSIVDALRAREFSNLILVLIDFVHRPLENHSKTKLNKAIAKKLQPLHRQICKDAEHFIDLDVDSQHRTRKRLKRLRYRVEFIASIYPNKEVKHYLKDLKPAQESLGQYNDLIVAENLYQSIVKQKQKVWFVLGWIANEKQHVLNQAQQDLKHYRQTDTFWS